MAQTKKSSAGRSRQSGKKNSRSGRAGQNRRTSEPMDVAIRNEIFLIILFAAAIFLFVCNFGIAGVVGNTLSSVMFGIFGLTAYVMPLVIFLMIAFGMVNSGSPVAARKLVAGAILFLIVGIVCDLFTGAPESAESYQLTEIYVRCSESHGGGGVIGGSLAYLSCRFLGMIGTVLVLLVAAIIAVVVVTEKSFVSGVKSGSRKVYERSMEERAYRQERAKERRAQMEETRKRREEEKKQRALEREDEKILRMDKKVTGVMLDTALTDKPGEKSKVRDDLHEINLTDFDEQIEQAAEIPEPEADSRQTGFGLDNIRINSAYLEEEDTSGTEGDDELSEITNVFSAMEDSALTPEPAFEEEDAQDIADVMPKSTFDGGAAATGEGRPSTEKPVKAAEAGSAGTVGGAKTQNPSQPLNKPVVPKKYIFPPIGKLAKGPGKNGGDSARELRETAQKLQQTLQNFGVRVTVTDISQGPSVTRFEMQPEQGVKVSKIVSLSDDIKLNLAATDIRIEAPIPGKAAVGIEVPNKENMMVALRDLIESREFKEFPSNLAFAVGKDIGGKVVVADIAKMPHMLIAGATGSGKSVCINTLIMSILYKAHPDDVKLIMVDPKVVELSVYNGIPHLLIPVVTDPKKASGALQWGVAEMTDRYQKFADFNVRDLKGYNKKVEAMKDKGDENAPAKMPQIVIIVDELADLMMVCPGEVEESICRLAQLARAAGIHLVIATQRPSVDVITGLIKANMPSRVAFSVSSGTDSRTILDMVGAEKLLGKGDMLFYPHGYTKPARVQCAFVSDKEVSDVVEFLKNQTLGNIYSPDIQEKITTMGSGGGASSGDGGERDQYFVEAARFIIEKDKASIGMLQRMFKIGFNRAARIMDQLCDAGVVGEEEGTKPRKVLMSEEQFEQYIEESL
ncbi:MAG: DNA translocase FtsK [Lachnospiraceae bacterium]|nr:DNA translocase FtsK [Lachnospiraceae bacterium]